MKLNMPEYAGDRRIEPSLADDLRALVQVFSSRWRLIVLIMATFLVLGLGFIWISTPAYTSSVDVFIDPRERSLVDPGTVPTGMGSSSQGADITLLESQITILKSRLVLGALVERERLDADPEFTAEASGPVAVLKSVAKGVLYGPNANSFSSQTPFERALSKLQDGVAVKRLEQTYVLNIAVTTEDPEKSARIANSLATIYLAEGQNASDQSTRETAQSLEARLAELRKASETSQRAVEDYRKQHGLMDTQGVLVDERQLTELSAKVTAASVATESARVTLDNLRRDGAVAATSDLATDLRSQLDQARSEESSLAGTLGPLHPLLVQAIEKRASLERALRAELDRVITRAESDYDKAKQTEDSLEALLAQSSNVLAQSNAASVKLKELQQTADQDRSLYDSFATKAKQMREQISLPTTTARVISIAEPAANPSAPKVPIVLAISLFFGVVIGFGVAWIVHIFAPTPKARRQTISLVPDEHQSVAAQ